MIGATCACIVSMSDYGQHSLRGALDVLESETSPHDCDTIPVCPCRLQNDHPADLPTSILGLSLLFTHPNSDIAKTISNISSTARTTSW